MPFVSRSQLGWPPTRAGAANPTSGLVIHYDGTDAGLGRGPHSECIAYWNRVRNYHMRVRGWADVGYSWFCCGHGMILEGRGLGHYQAAQGTTAGNSDWYSATLALGPTEQPTDAQINAVRELRTWLIRRGVAGKLAAHRDFTSTRCPGPILTRMVRDGSFAGSPDTIREEPMPDYVSVDKTPDSRNETLQDGQWAQIYFDRNNSAAAGGHHADGDWPSLLRGPCTYTGKITLRVADCPPGLPLQARIIEVTEESAPKWEIIERDHPIETFGTGGDTFAVIPATGHVGRGRRLRVEITHYGGPGPTPRVIGGQVRLQVWKL